MSLKYIRLIDLLGKKGYKRMRNRNVVLVGVGAIGSEIAKNLVTLGISSLTLVDRDYVEMPNICLSLLYDEVSAENKRKKANVAAEKLKTINSDVKVQAIPRPVEKVETKTFREADATFLAVDNDATRLRINSLFLEEEFESYLLDCGAHGLRGEVNTVNPPKTGCLRCVSLLKESATHPCLPSHFFDPQTFIEYIELAKIRFYDQKNEILDPDNQNHIDWIIDELRSMKKIGKNENIKREIRDALKNQIHFYPSTYIRVAALATKKFISLTRFKKSEIYEKKGSFFTQIKILGNTINETPIHKKKNCPQCGKSKISVMIDKEATLEKLIQKIRNDYGILSPRVWKTNGELLFDVPQNLSTPELNWVNEKLHKEIRKLDLKDNERILVQSNLTDNIVECQISIRNR